MHGNTSFTEISCPCRVVLSGFEVDDVASWGSNEDNIATPKELPGHSMVDDARWKRTRPVVVKYSFQSVACLSAHSHCGLCAPRTCLAQRMGVLQLDISDFAARYTGRDRSDEVGCAATAMVICAKFRPMLFHIISYSAPSLACHFCSHFTNVCHVYLSCSDLLYSCIACVAAEQFYYRDTTRRHTLPE